MRVNTVFVWMAVVAAFAPAQEIFPRQQLDRIRLGLAAIYALEHKRAEAIFEQMIAESPDDAAGYAYLATTLWRKQLSEMQELSIDRFASSGFFAENARPLVTVDPTFEAQFRQLSADAIARAKRRLRVAPEDKASLFVLGLTYQNLATFEASLKRNWWSAVRYGSRAYQYHRELLRRDPKIHDARLATGVYTYVAGSLDWSVRWLALLMGYWGSQERGKRDIELAAREGQLAADDASVILVLIHTRERDYQRAYDRLAGLAASYPQNYLLHLGMAGLALLMNERPKAIAIYEQILNKHEAGIPNYHELERASVYNRLGVASRQQSDLPESSRWFRRALAEPELSGRSSAIAHLELGKTLEMMGARQDAAAEYRVAAAAPDFAGTRSEANKLLKECTNVR